MKQFGVLLLICLGLVHTVHSTVLIQVEFRSNPCSTVLFFPECKPYFKVCLSTPKQRCQDNMVKTSTIQRERVHIFDWNDKMPDPVYFKLGNITEVPATITIDIMRKIFLIPDSLIDSATWTFNGSQIYNVPVSGLHLTGVRKKESVTVDIAVRCDKNFFGPTCDNYCVPDMYSTCDSAGKKECLPGYTGKSCQERKVSQGSARTTVTHTGSLLFSTQSTHQLKSSLRTYKSQSETSARKLKSKSATGQTSFSTVARVSVQTKTTISREVTSTTTKDMPSSTLFSSSSTRTQKPESTTSKFSSSAPQASVTIKQTTHEKATSNFTVKPHSSPNLSKSTTKKISLSTPKASVTTISTTIKTATSVNPQTTKVLPTTPKPVFSTRKKSKSSPKAPVTTISTTIKTATSVNPQTPKVSPTTPKPVFSTSKISTSSPKVPFTTTSTTIQTAVTVDPLSTEMLSSTSKTKSTAGIASMSSPYLTVTTESTKHKTATSHVPADIKSSKQTPITPTQRSIPAKTSMSSSYVLFTTKGAKHKTASPTVTLKTPSSKIPPSSSIVTTTVTKSVSFTSSRYLAGKKSGSTNDREAWAVPVTATLGALVFIVAVLAVILARFLWKRRRRVPYIEMLDDDVEAEGEGLYDGGNLHLQLEPQNKYNDKDTSSFSTDGGSDGGS